MASVHCPSLIHTSRPAHAATSWRCDSQSGSVRQSSVFLESQKQSRPPPPAAACRLHRATPAGLRSSRSSFSSLCLRDGNQRRGKIASKHRKSLVVAEVEPARSSSVERDEASTDFPEDSSTPLGTCDPLCSVDDMSSMEFSESYKPKTDLLKAVAVGATVLAGAGIINHSWVAENQGVVPSGAHLEVRKPGSPWPPISEQMRTIPVIWKDVQVTDLIQRILKMFWDAGLHNPIRARWNHTLTPIGMAINNLAMAGVFVLGYAGIIFEESLVFNKSGVGLLMAVTLWVIRSIGAPSTDVAVAQLQESSSEVSEIVFFLLGAMTIVEIVDAHQGFKLVTDSITTRKPRLLLWVVGGITFFLSSVLDNLTSTIVMVSLLRKLVTDPERRKSLGAVVVIAANAGGAWTPIGDVTTTMLWIHGQISTVRTMQDLFIPSAVSLLVPLTLLTIFSDKEDDKKEMRPVMTSEQLAPRGKLVFAVGVGALLFVPVFKQLTGLPPYLGMLLGLGTLWILTDAIHYGDTDRQRLKVPQALSRIDTQGVLFFLGILLSVGSLQSAGLLQQLATYLDEHIPSVELVATVIGLASAVIDNVPLVAATMGMYNLSTFPQDSELWQLIAYCAGTGGSILIIGSAAGVAFMGMEKADFFWYTKKVSGPALAGYAAGIVAYLAAFHFHDSPLYSLLGQLPHIPVLPGFS